jgi:hypothetical protein
VRIAWTSRTSDLPGLNRYNRLMRAYLVICYGPFALLAGLN